MRIASTGTMPLTTTTTASTANQSLVNNELARMLSTEPIAATVKTVQGGQAVLDLGGTTLTVNLKDGQLQAGQQVTVRFNEEGRGTVLLESGETAVVTVAGNEETPAPTTALPPARTYPQAASYSPYHPSKTVPTFSHPIARAEFLSRSNDGSYQVRIDGRELTATFRENVEIGSKVVVRIEASAKGITLIPLPDTTLLPGQVAGAVLRNTKPVPLGNSLQQLVQTLSQFVQTGQPTPIATPESTRPPLTQAVTPETPGIPASLDWVRNPVAVSDAGQTRPEKASPTSPNPAPPAPTLPQNTSAESATPTRVPLTAAPLAKLLPALTTASNTATPLNTPIPAETTSQLPLTMPTLPMEQLEAVLEERARIRDLPTTNKPPPLPAAVEQLPKILSTMIPRSDQAPSAEQLEALVRDGGLHYESKIGRAVEARARPEVIQEIPQTDLKGSLLQAIQEVPETSREGVTLRGTLETIETQQALNVLSHQAGEGIRLQLPIIDGTAWRTVDLMITPERTATEGETSSEQQGRGYGISLHTELSELGETWIDAQVLGSQFRAYLYIENEEARQQASAELNSLQSELQALGYKQVLLDVRAPLEMSRNDRERIHAQKGGVPRGISLIDVRA